MERSVVDDRHRIRIADVPGPLNRARIRKTLARPKDATSGIHNDLPRSSQGCRLYCVDATVRVEGNRSIVRDCSFQVEVVAGRNDETSTTDGGNIHPAVECTVLALNRAISQGRER